MSDLTIVGAGPAGAATALGALSVEPRLRVTLLDRADFPRDKACGDGIAPHVLDLLAEVGVTGLLDDRTPVDRLRLSSRGQLVERTMARPAWVVPRAVLDARLVAAAQSAGARLVRQRVRSLEDVGHAAVVVGADGARSVLRRALGRPEGPTALALRGYAPTPPGRRGAQVIVFGTERQPAYAWSFDRGDGLANVGYGELLTDRPPPTRHLLLEQLEALLPGSTAGGTGWTGHHLPLSTARWQVPDGRVLLVGDAAGLVNPLSGEGIYYAVATGLAAGRAAAEAIALGRPTTAGRRYRSATRPLLSRHLRHTALASRLTRGGPVLEAGLRAAGRDQRVFDDLVELALASGRLTPALLRGLAHGLARGVLPAPRPVPVP
ncbi:hyaluronate lyase [Nocardioides dongxiaopingii]|uniref:NAD(P)/FAD-dependent oxidoreductase n=1 Tax=Nocardioides sp. S-1144 TaxID=2582905 RepID=UPI00110D9E41|nr:hyaluronate lyase [Nocardioides sp. S-1144]QCW51899.1 hyaluronate lyase [Nocardioides sp. S-1144]